MNDEPLAVATLAILAGMAYGSYLGFRRPGFMDRFLFSPRPILARKEYWRLVTSAFLHADWMHFGLNAVTLYLFGRHVEETCGPAVLLAIFFASVVGGDLLALWLHRHHAYQALGASGGVCGILFASIFLLPGGSIRLLLLPIPIPAWLYAILFIGASAYGIRAARDDIGHDAHLGGAIVGLLVTTAIRPSIVQESPLTYALVMLLSVAALVLVVKGRPRTGAGHGWSPRRLLTSIRQAMDRADRHRERQEDQAVDRILEKIAREGMDSLTDRERQILRDASDRKRSKR